MSADNNSVSDQFRNERVLYLKELGDNADIDAYELADRMSISKEAAMAFLRSYFKTLAQFTNRDDQLEKSRYSDIKDIINSSVSVEFGGLNDRHIDNLMYVYEKYRTIDPNLYLEADAVRSNRIFPAQVPLQHQQQRHQTAHSGGSSSIPNPNVKPDINMITNAPRAEHDDYETGAGRFNVDRLNKGHSYDFLQQLSRKGLVQWVLEGLPVPPSTPKIENYMQYFEINQDEIFISPDTLRASLIGWFGDKTGATGASLIYSYLKFLKPTEGFGQLKLSGHLREGYFEGDNPLYQKPNATGPSVSYAHYGGGAAQRSAYSDGYPGFGPRFQDPYNTYYHAQMVLPFGMSAYSDDARRLIHDYEITKKQKAEEREKNMEILDQIRNSMSMNMAKIFDGKGPMGMMGGMGGQQNQNQIFTPEFLQGLVTTSAITGITQGRMQAMPYMNPETGKMEVKLSPVEQQVVSGHDDGALTMDKMFDTIKGMYETIDRKRDEAVAFKIDTLKELYGNKDGQGGPLQQLGETFKALKEIIPGFDAKFSGGGGDSHAIELHKLLLEKDKFVYDREKTDKLIEYQFEKKDKQEQYAHDNELAANKSRNIAMKSIANVLASNLPMLLNIVIMFLSMRNPKLASMAAGLGGMGGGGGGGATGAAGLTSFIGDLLKGITGGAGGDNDSDEEEEDDENPFSTKKKKKRPATDDEDEDEGSGFAMGGLEGMFGQAMDLIKNIGAKGASIGPEEGAVVDSPMPHRHVHQHVHQGRRVPVQSRTGVRPTFRNVEIGNSNATVVMPMPGEEPANAYEDIENETKRRLSVTKNRIGPSIQDAKARFNLKPFQAAAEGEEEDTNVYGDIINNAAAASVTAVGEDSGEPQVIIPDAAGPVQEFQVQAEAEVIETESEPEQDTQQEYPQFTPEHFEGWSVEQLRNAKREGLASKMSSDSYYRSVEQKLRETESHD